jgi:hypothetical protein
MVKAAIFLTLFVRKIILIYFSEPPEAFNRMQSLHIGNTVQPGDRPPEIYNMPATLTNYHVNQIHHPIPPTNPQLFNPMFHYPQEQRPHHMPAYDSDSVPNYGLPAGISVPTYTPQVEVPVVNFAVPAPVIAPVVPPPFEPPPIPVPTITQETKIPEAGILLKTELSEDDEELEEEESEISGEEDVRKINGNVEGMIFLCVFFFSG